jgi:hypothetical protein
MPATSDPDFKGPGIERGTYYLFDPNQWEKVRKTNFVLSYDALERHPITPALDRQSH